MSTHAIAPGTSTTHIWDAVSRPPATALKQIKGGRLTGMTDVNPQWRYRAMTEVFGPCGQGWKYEIVRTWTEQGTEGQVLAFCEVHLWWRENPGAEWDGPIPGIGGSMLVAKESGGLRTNDEGFKMATTDALSVAMKMLGVAADIYAGLWDGSKYKEEAVQPKIQMPRRLSEVQGNSGGKTPVEEVRRLFEVKKVEPPEGYEQMTETEREEYIQTALKASIAVSEAAEQGVIDEGQRRRLFALMREGGHSKEDVSAWLLREHGISSSKNIPVGRYATIAERLKSQEPLNG